MSQAKRYEIKINVVGDFSFLKNKKEQKFLGIDDKTYTSCNSGVEHYIYNHKPKGSRTLYASHGSSMFISFYKSHEDDIFGWLGCTDRIKEGYINPNTHNSPLFKTREDAAKYLLDKKFNSLTEASFGFFAQKEFYYTPNYLLNKDGEIKLDFLAELLMRDGYGSHFNHNKEIALKISQMYLNAGVTGYVGQNGYTTEKRLHKCQI